MIELCSCGGLRNTTPAGSQLWTWDELMGRPASPWCAVGYSWVLKEGQLVSSAVYVLESLSDTSGQFQTLGHTDSEECVKGMSVRDVSGRKGVADIGWQRNKRRWGMRVI